MSKKKKRKANLGKKLVGIFMLLLMISSSVIGIVAYLVG